MKLIEQAEAIVWPDSHYLYIEKTGDIPTQAPLAWRELMPHFAEIVSTNRITGRMSLYKVSNQVYRAGVTLGATPNHLSQGLQYCVFHGGRYLRFVLSGPYSDLPAATQRVFHIVEERKIELRDDFWIENYVSDPTTSPAEEQVTQILVPVA